ncbi:YlxR family protein [Brevibacterium yomogidense]|uniref:YlxR family protein n=1 Tax=Brevibacterium yomogidense TaxID=946573 RepID=UPI0038CC00B9
MCIACRRRAPRSQLLRLAVLVTDEPRIVVDADRRLPGRGAWIHDSAACWKKARAKRAFSTAFKVPGLSGPEPVCEEGWDHRKQVSRMDSV